MGYFPLLLAFLWLIVPFTLVGVERRWSFVSLAAPSLFLASLSHPLLWVIHKNLLFLLSFKKIAKPCNFYTNKYSYFGCQDFLVLKKKFEPPEFVNHLSFPVEITYDNFSLKVSRDTSQGLSSSNNIFEIEFGGDTFPLILRKSNRIFEENVNTILKSRLPIIRDTNSLYIHVPKFKDITRDLTECLLVLENKSYRTVGYCFEVEKFCSVHASLTLALGASLGLIPLSIMNNLVIMVSLIPFYLYVASTVFYSIWLMPKGSEEMKDKYTLNRHNDNTIMGLINDKSDQVWCNVFSKKRVYNPNLCFTVCLEDKRNAELLYSNSEDILVRENFVPDGFELNMNGSLNFTCSNEIEMEIKSSLINPSNVKEDVEINLDSVLEVKFRRRGVLFAEKAIITQNYSHIYNLLNLCYCVIVGGNCPFIEGGASFVTHAPTLQEVLDKVETDMLITKHENVRRNISFFVGQKFASVENLSIYNSLMIGYPDHFNIILNHNYYFFGTLKIGVIGDCLFKKVPYWSKRWSGNAQFKKYTSDLKLLLNSKAILFNVCTGNMSESMERSIKEGNSHFLFNSDCMEVGERKEIKSVSVLDSSGKGKTKEGYLNYEFKLTCFKKPEGILPIKESLESLVCSEETVREVSEIDTEGAEGKTDCGSVTNKIKIESEFSKRFYGCFISDENSLDKIRHCRIKDNTEAEEASLQNELNEAIRIRDSHFSNLNNLPKQERWMKKDEKARIKKQTAIAKSEFESSELSVLKLKNRLEGLMLARNRRQAEIGKLHFLAMIKEKDFLDVFGENQTFLFCLNSYRATGDLKTLHKNLLNMFNVLGRTSPRLNRKINSIKEIKKTGNLINKFNFFCDENSPVFLMNIHNSISNGVKKIEASRLVQDFLNQSFGLKNRREGRGRKGKKRPKGVRQMKRKFNCLSVRYLDLLRSLRSKEIYDSVFEHCRKRSFSGVSLKSGGMFLKKAVNLLLYNCEMELFGRFLYKNRKTEEIDNNRYIPEIFRN